MNQLLKALSMLNLQSEDVLLAIKSRLVARIWKGLALLAIIAVPASISRATDTGWLDVYSFHIAAGVFIILVYLLQPYISYKRKAALLIGLFMAIGCIGLIALGLLGAGVWWLVVSSLLIYILYSIRSGILSVVFSMAFTILCATLYVNGSIILPVDANLYIASASSWVSLLAAITLMPLVVFQAIGIYQGSIMTLLAKIETQRAEIEHISMHDQLTNLASLSLTQDRFEIASSLAARQNTKVALLFIDLDGFKTINDTHGHDAGDKALIKVAAHLKSICRRGDTAARVGGDEFMLLLSNINTPEEAMNTAQRVVDIIELPVIFQDIELQVSASVGVSLFPDDANNLNLLRKKADEAMYSVKKGGKNGCQLYTHNMIN